MQNNIAMFDCEIEGLPVCPPRSPVHTAMGDFEGFPTSPWSRCGTTNSLGDEHLRLKAATVMVELLWLLLLCFAVRAIARVFALCC